MSLSCQCSSRLKKEFLFENQSLSTNRFSYHATNQVIESFSSEKCWNIQVLVLNEEVFRSRHIFTYHVVYVNAHAWNDWFFGLDEDEEGDNDEDLKDNGEGDQKELIEETEGTPIKRRKKYIVGAYFIKRSRTETLILGKSWSWTFRKSGPCVKILCFG